jgi:phosphoglycolate phosphatase
MKDLRSFRTVLFDLDGTLVDNFQAIYLCYRHATEQLGVAPVSYAEVRATVGGSINVTMERLLGAELAPRGVALFREHSPKVLFEGLEVLSGARELLTGLRHAGVQTALFTNKCQGAAEDLCAHLGFTPLLDGLFGTTPTSARKPEPAFTEHALQSLGADPATTVVIGDSPFDLAAASTHGMACHLVATGSHTRAQLLAEQPAPDAVWDSLEALARDGFRLPSAPFVVA